MWVFGPENIPPSQEVCALGGCLLFEVGSFEEGAVAEYLSERKAHAEDEKGYGEGRAILTCSD
jgi:hypothetical protein